MPDEKNHWASYKSFLGPGEPALRLHDESRKGTGPVKEKEEHSEEGKITAHFPEQSVFFWMSRMSFVW